MQKRHCLKGYKVVFVIVCVFVCLLVYTFKAGVDRELRVCDFYVGNAIPKIFLSVCVCVCVCVYVDGLFSTYVCGNCM